MSHVSLFSVLNDDLLAAISAIVGVFHRIGKVDQRFHMTAMGTVQPFENDRNIPNRKENRCNKNQKLNIRARKTEPATKQVMNHAKYSLLRVDLSMVMYLLSQILAKPQHRVL